MRWTAASTKRLARGSLFTALALLSTVAGADRGTQAGSPRPPAAAAAGAEPRGVREERGTAKGIITAFRSLPGTAPARALVRRFGDSNAMAWNMVLETIAAAKPGRALKSSFFTTEKDPYGWAYVGGLLYSQMRGVEVTHLNDWSANARGRGFVSHGGGLSVLQELRRYGATVGLYNTPGKRVKYLAKNGLAYGLIGCDHDKALVVNPGTEDAQGLNGGRNIGKAYFEEASKEARRRDGTIRTTRGDNDEAWRDDTIQVKGKEACTGFALAVDREVRSPATKLLKAPALGLRSRAREMLAAYALMEEWVSRDRPSAEEKARLRADPAAHAELAAEVLAAADKRLSTMIEALPAATQKTIPSRLGWFAGRNLKKLANELTRDLELCGTRAAYEQRGGFMKAAVKVIDQTGAPSAEPGHRFNEMGPSLHHLILSAGKQITVINPYVVLTEDMVKAFEKAAKHRVKITIVTNSPLSTDSAITQGFFLNNWSNVLARVPTMRVWVATGKRKIHAKAFMIDGILSADTTYNADLISAEINGELGTLSLSRRVASDLGEGIARDLKNPAEGFKEWTIKRDAAGRAVLDGKGRPIVLQGPGTDLGWKLRALYAPVRWLCSALTHTRACAPLRLRQAKDVLPGREF